MQQEKKSNNILYRKKKKKNSIGVSISHSPPNPFRQTPQICFELGGEEEEENPLTHIPTDMLEEKKKKGKKKDTPSAYPPNHADHTNRITPIVSLPPRRLNRLLQPHNPQTLPSSQFAIHQSRGGNKLVIPVSKHGLHIAGDALEHNVGKRHKRAIFLGDGKHAVLLCKEKRGRKRGGLGAGESADDTVKEKKISICNN